MRRKRQIQAVGMNDSKALFQLVQGFFQDYLAGQRALSQNTILAYRDALKLFLSFLATNTKKPTARLQMADLHAEQVLAFLDDVERTRHNSTATRNLRLAAPNLLPIPDLGRHRPIRPVSENRGDSAQALTAPDHGLSRTR